MQQPERFHLDRVCVCEDSREEMWGERRAGRVFLLTFPAVSGIFPFPQDAVEVQKPHALLKITLINPNPAQRSAPMCLKHERWYASPQQPITVCYCVYRWCAVVMETEEDVQYLCAGIRGAVDPAADAFIFVLNLRTSRWLNSVSVNINH